MLPQSALHDGQLTAPSCWDAWKRRIETRNVIAASLMMEVVVGCNRKPPPAPQERGTGRGFALCRCTRSSF